MGVFAIPNNFFVTLLTAISVVCAERMTEIKSSNGE
jgi:hypothetical protein